MIAIGFVESPKMGVVSEVSVQQERSGAVALRRLRVHLLLHHIEACADYFEKCFWGNGIFRWPTVFLPCMSLSPGLSSDH